MSSYPRKLPVIVFVHGESFEWNSGNPYDGSVLASYGQVGLSMVHILDDHSEHVAHVSRKIGIFEENQISDCAFYLNKCLTKIK